ncbi:NADH:flavin oxidoreductase [Dietzia sp. CH92]|uniref:NADH:flavin oxidoreductase n=1 Tax=Dietzia sp. CH92 TaxID=3051823 RepID=UPI0028D01124|nr:NADH:flavin oxidoreductase [Dietzia sp. CH92]
MTESTVDRRTVFEQVQLGPVTLRNRTIKAATSEGRSPEGRVTDELIAFHEAFARGGVGMTTLAYCATTRAGFSAPGQILMTRDAVPGLREFTDAMHAADAKASAQLGHAGPVGSKKITGQRPMAPSRFLSPTSFQLSRGISVEEIREATRQFADAAELAVEAGFDAVELHFGHLYLPSAFLSPWINKRTDGYGGSIENRTRFVREIAEAVKQRIGDSAAILAKLSMTDGIKGSIRLEESLQSARMLDADGHLDALELTQGSSVFHQMYLFRGDVPIEGFAGAMSEPFKTGVKLLGKPILGEYEYHDLYMLGDARQFVRSMKNTKLILLGGINSLDHMQTGLDEGFDFVAMGRALLREPDLVGRMRVEPGITGRCDHNNGCMFTVYGKTHCVYEPDFAQNR